MATKKSSGIGLTAMPEASPMKMTREQAQREAQYRAESDLRILKDAHEIMRDRGRMKNVKMHAMNQMKVVRKITGRKP